MHELGISRNIVAIVADAARGRRVRRVALEIGRFAGVEREAILFCFEVAAQGTAVEGAVLDIRDIEGRARCNACAAEFATDSLLTPCACGSRRLQRLAGDELNVKSIEIEEAA
jgi:hydrogenase nickel incorporation protein HypA/HybF